MTDPKEPITTLDREGLYERVWSVPMTQLAKSYGISDVALAKLCKSMNVPKPGRGYWARLKGGKTSNRPPLPVPSDATRTRVEIRRQSPARPNPVRLARGPAIMVPDVLASPHRLVHEVERTLARAKQDRDGMIGVRGAGGLVVAVSAAQKDRALCILDTLLQVIEERGHRVAKRLADMARPSVTIAGEGLSLRLKERLLQSPHKPTPEERASERRYGWSHGPTVDYTPSGRLRLQVCRAGGIGSDATWSDTDRRPLERRIGDIAVGLELLAESIKEDRRLAQEEKRRFEEQWARREAEARRQESERKRFEELRSEAARWKEAQVVREYIDAVEQAGVERGDRDTMSAWLAWARERVEGFDPIKRITCKAAWTDDHG